MFLRKWHKIGIVAALVVAWCFYLRSIIDLAATTWNSPAWTIGGVLLLGMIFVVTPLFAVATAIVLVFLK